MKFKHYLLMESNYRPITHDFSEIREILHRDCKKILSIYRSTRGGLFRGEEIRNSDLILKQSRLENRKPKHTPQDVHDLLNKLFKNKFGWNVRNGVFVSSKYTTANDYGEVFYFFPAGNFKFCWSPKITDLYNDIIDLHHYQELTDYEFLQDEIIDKYTDSNLVSAIKSRREISFNVSKYYLLSYDVMEWRNKIDYIIGK